MNNILNFLILSIKYLTRPLFQIKDSSEESKYVPTEIALKAIDLSAAYWLSIAKLCWVIMKAKRSEPLHVIHQRVQTVMDEFDELKDFDLSKGNPYLHLMSLRALTRKEMIVKYGDQVHCINYALLEKMVVVIITYNFFKKYKERSRGHFEKAELDMRELVETNKLPGRFSWNNFVIKEQKQKSVQDFSFIDMYGPPTTDAQGVQREQGASVEAQGNGAEPNQFSDQTNNKPDEVSGI